jgi:hypothetical protein
MRILYSTAFLLALGLVSCNSSNRAAHRDDPAARQAGREAYRASQEAKRAGKKAAKELRNAGREFREGWGEAKHQRPDRREH